MDGIDRMYEINDVVNSLSQIYSQDINEIIEGLSGISNVLLYDVNLLSNFPIEQFCIQIIKILAYVNNDNINKLATSCINSLLDTQKRTIAFLINNGILGVIYKMFLCKSSKETIINCILILKHISDYRPSEVLNMIGIEPILNYFEIMDIPTQRKAIEIIQQITSVSSNQSNFKFLTRLINLYNNSKNVYVQENVVKSINNIVSYTNTQLIDINIIKFLCSSSKFYKGLIHLSKEQNYIEMIISLDIDFNNILEEDKTIEKQENVLKLLINLLPITHILNILYGPSHRRPNASKEFAKKIQPFLLNILMKIDINLNLLLKALAATLESNLFELTEDIIITLKNLASTNPLLVLVILSYYSNSELIATSRILEKMDVNNVDSSHKQWFSYQLEKLEKDARIMENEQNYSNLSIKEIIDLVLSDKISKLKLLEINLNKFIGFDFSIYSHKQISKLMKFITTLLSFIQIPVDLNTDCIPRMIKTLSKNANFLILLPQNNKICISLPLYCNVRAIEGWYNELMYKRGTSKIEKMIQSKPFLNTLIQISDFRQISTTQMSVMYHAFQDDYQSIYITHNNNSYNANASLLQIKNSKGKLKKNISVTDQIHLFHGTCKNDSFICSKIGDKKLSSLLDLIMYLNQYTKIKYNDKFIKKVHDLLYNPFDSLSINSLGLKLLYEYPKIFPFELKLFGFYLKSLEPRRALMKIIKEFQIQGNDLKSLSQETFKVHVYRDSIFNDGCNIFNHFSQNHQRLEISFYNEPGIGLGPTREFFTLFSHELCLTEHKIFRSDSNEKGYAKEKQGMFFSPIVSLKAAKLLGRFIAKAIQMECLVDINFNPNIFKFLRNKEVNIEDIDITLARSLNCPEGLIGLPFTYPGLDFPLKIDTNQIDVTESNVNEYIQLIKEYTCGKQLDNIRNSFIEGFSEIFPFSYLNIFNEDEICRILRGDGPQFTFKDLEEYVEISHGYDKNSPQISMLFEVLSELNNNDQHLLIQFITGYCQLPIGGLSALEPRLTIAKRSFEEDGIDPDTQLPSVMTCTNYFKVPSYTNKGIMREKILLAIHEGQDSFQLT